MNTYTVKSGDNLYKIARQHNVSLSDLIRWNQKNLKGTLIRPGDIIYLQDQQPEGEWINVDEMQQMDNEANNTNNENIIHIGNKSRHRNYAIIDKSKRTVTVFDKNGQAIWTNKDRINTGSSHNDYLTKTYTENGKLKNKQGNMSTPAGITIVSGIGTYHGAPTFIRAAVGNDGKAKTYKDEAGNTNTYNIASSIHWASQAGLNDEGSNGCVRMSPEDLRAMAKYISPGDFIYTLPEQPGSYFKLNNGKVEFHADKPYGNDERSGWGDYLTNHNKSTSPIRIVRKKTLSGKSVSESQLRRVSNNQSRSDDESQLKSKTNPISEIIEDITNGISHKVRSVRDETIKGATNFLRLFNGAPTIYTNPLNGGFYLPASNGHISGNERLAEIGNKNMNAFASTLQNKKKDFQSMFRLTDGAYDRLAQIALGLPQQESKYGTSYMYQFQIGMPNSVRLLAGKSPARSYGISKIKMTSDNDELQQIYKKLDLTPENVQKDPSKAAAATFAKLAYIYNTEIVGQKFYDENGEPIDQFDALLAKYNGQGRKLRTFDSKYPQRKPNEHYGTVPNYASKVKKYSRDLFDFSVFSEK